MSTDTSGRMIIIIHVRSMGFGRDLLYDRLEAMYIANYLIFFLDDKNIFLEILGEQRKKVITILR